MENKYILKSHNIGLYETVLALCEGEIKFINHFINLLLL